MEIPASVIMSLSKKDLMINALQVDYLFVLIALPFQEARNS